MTSNAKISEEAKVSQIQLNSSDIPIDLCSELLQKHGMTLYEIIWFENDINDTQIFKLLQQILDRACEQINSPSLLSPKVSLFFTAHQMISGLKKNTKSFLLSEIEVSTVISNPLIHALRQLPYEKRVIYLLKTKENLTYRDLETITIRHRDEIGLFLTEAREFLRKQLSGEAISLPFPNNPDLCPLIFKYLSPYLDYELNALNVMEVEKHLFECDKCLQILANHQYIAQQVNHLQLITNNELLSHFWTENNSNKSIKEKKGISTPIENNPPITPYKRKFHFLKSIWKFLRRKHS